MTQAVKLPRRKAKVRPLFDGPEWTFELIRKVHDTMGEIAIGELGLDIYPNQIEVITAEQMLDSYSSIGMPLMYRHWSFGKRFARDEAYYKRGMRSLAGARGTGPGARASTRRRPSASTSSAAVPGSARSTTAASPAFRGRSSMAVAERRSRMR